MFSWARFLRPAIVLVVLLGFAMAVPAADAQPTGRKLDKTLSGRAQTGVGVSKVIVRFQPGMDASADAKKLGATLGRRMRNGRRVMRVPNSQLNALAQHPAVKTIRWDRPISGLPITSQSSQTVASIAQSLGYTGSGVGVAIIDSGITPWHDEFTYSGSSRRVLTNGGQRVAAFVDYVNGQTTPYDDYGHGTHVAGIIAGNGLGSSGTRMGAAPDAHLVVLKVLNASGTGSISDVVDAVEYATEHKDDFNIRVINLSIAAKPIDPEGTLEDDLAEATKLAAEAGIVVVAAAGNLGWDKDTKTQQYGGITAPGVYPWVLTVGAYDPHGTPSHKDDEIARFSSRGPTAYTFLAKPDLAAPGVGIKSLADPTSKLHTKMMANGLLGGGQHISLSGTSVAAPAVSGTVALMAQANPSVTPNLAKAILQFTAWVDPDHDRLTQGAGYMNPQGALTLTRYFGKAQAGDRYPLKKAWSREIIWGNYLMSGGVIWPNGSAWATTTTWGETVDEEKDNIVWGTLCAPEDCDNIVWGTYEDLDNIVWGTDEDGDNIVWGTRCGDGADTDEDCDNIVWGTTTPETEDKDNIVWGTCADEDCDNIVWGTAEDLDNIVWGTLEDLDNIVWGTECNGEDCDNIVWGTACGSDEDCDNIVWGTAEDDDNIVWGTLCTATSCDWNVVWGTVFGDIPEVSGPDFDDGSGEFNIVWGTEFDDGSGEFNIVWGTTVTTQPVTTAPALPWTAKKQQPRGSSRR